MPIRPTQAFLLALTLATPALAAADPAPPTTLQVRNDTDTPVNQLFVYASKAGGLKTKVKSIFGTADDDRDRLETATLARGRSVAVDLDGKHCRFDLRAVLEDGRTYLAEGIDACATGHWDVASGRLR